MRSREEKQLPRWIDLRQGGRLWGRYCPELRRLELARGNERALFNLTDFDDIVGFGESSRSDAIHA